MELWNSRRLYEPPTYTYKAQTSEIDVDHLRTIIRDGITFFKDQVLMDMEIDLVRRIAYRMKSTFRTSKDFKTFEKVKRCLGYYKQIEIVKKLEHFASLIPSYTILNGTFLPTKNMIDFILVRLQGIGKILCRTIDLCKQTAEFYGCRLRLGHFWQIAVIIMGIVSRVHLLALNIIKFTCLLYFRMFPFSHKLKNTGKNWLPEDYTLPKDLKEWLNIDWRTKEEIIEIPDREFERAFLDLADDSDDDIEVCDEYIEIKDDDMNMSGYKKSKKMRNKRNDFLEDSVVILRGFASGDVDTGEVISDGNDEDVIENNENSDKNDITILSSSEDESQREKITKVETEKINNNTEEIDIGEIIAPDEKNNNDDISSDELEWLKDNSASFMKFRKPILPVSDFIPLDSSAGTSQNNRNIKRERRQAKNSNALDDTIIEILDTPQKKVKKTFKNNNANVNNNNKRKRDTLNTSGSVAKKAKTETPEEIEEKLANKKRALILKARKRKKNRKERRARNKLNRKNKANAE